MGRVTVKDTVYVPLNVAYRCSKCGKINYTQHIVSETREVSRYGALATSKNINEMKGTSLKYSKEAMGQLLTKIFEESKTHKYRSAKFNLYCTKCGNQEPWSKMRFTKIDTILGSLMPFAILFAFVYLFGKAYLEFIYIAGGYGTIVGMWFFIKHLLIKAMEKRISELPEDSLPIFSLNETELLEMANKQFGGV